MIPNSSITPLTIDQPRRASRWIPRSRTGWGILILATVCAAGPAYYSAGLALIMFVCFDECGTPVQITKWVLVAIVLALSPLAAVRIYQDEHLAATRSRLTVTAGLLLALAVLSWFTWTGRWPL